MASRPIGGESAIVTFPGAMPPMPAVARILARHDRQHLAAFIAVAIDLCDAMDGDIEAEPVTWTEAVEVRSQGLILPDDSELAGDEADTGWIEWQTMRGSQKRGPNIAKAHEDDEEDDDDTSVEDGREGFDPEVDCCSAGDDRICSGAISGPGLFRDDVAPGDAEDAEREQMPDDVPMLPVLSAAHNLFTDARVSLGLSNLQTSYRTNGNEVLSADTGAVLRSTGYVRQPGEPV